MRSKHSSMDEVQKKGKKFTEKFYLFKKFASVDLSKKFIQVNLCTDEK